MAKFNIDAVEEKTMHGLKDFQRATVERIYHLFENGQNRVLVADEVGMGKTIEAISVLKIYMQNIQIMMDQKRLPLNQNLLLFLPNL